MRKSISRRTLLHGGAGCLIALPLLDGMRVARAQATAPARLITYHEPYAMFADAFWPPEPGKPQYDKKSGKIAELPTSGVGFMDNPAYEFTEILKPLESIRNEVLVLEGLQNAGNNHDGYCSILTGYEQLERSDTDVTGGGISLDHYMAQKLGYDKSMRFASMQLGVIVEGNGSKSAVSWVAQGQSVPAENSPRNVFNKLFPNGAATQTTTPMPVSADMLRARQKSVLDAALDQAAALRPSLSTLDQQKVDQYLEAFRSVEQRIDVLSKPTATCAAPAYPADYSLQPEQSQDSYYAQQPEIADVMMDLSAMAFACDLTRIITFQMNEEGNDLVFTWIPQQRGRWHQLSHIFLQPGQVPYELNPADPAQMSWWEDVQNYINVSVWNAQQVYKLQDKLKQHGVYDNTLLLWTTNMGQGNTHGSINIPLVLLGNVNNYFKTGRHIRLDIPGEYRRINDLHVNILNAFGVPDTSFGFSEFNKGPILEIKA
ncbi:MAG: DUF1552 domain-containing protein [Polyangiaceae bacterium]|nr:DUF1552 domain-containing protein [Polyangiaceae bacterium]